MESTGQTLSFVILAGSSLLSACRVNICPLPPPPPSICSYWFANTQTNWPDITWTNPFNNMFLYKTYTGSFRTIICETTTEPWMSSCFRVYTTLGFNKCVTYWLLHPGMKSDICHVLSNWLSSLQQCSDEYTRHSFLIFAHTCMPNN